MPESVRVAEIIFLHDVTFTIRAFFMYPDVACHPVIDLAGFAGNHFDLAAELVITKSGLSTHAFGDFIANEVFDNIQHKRLFIHDFTPPFFPALILDNCCRKNSNHHEKTKTTMILKKHSTRQAALPQIQRLCGKHWPGD